MSTRVIIVRHGQSTYNAQKMIQGRCDESVLTEKGLADAQQVAEALRVIKIDGFYSSPLQRAKRTAEVIHGSLANPPSLQPTDKLLEIDLPLWETKKRGCPFAVCRRISSVAHQSSRIQNDFRGR